MGNDFPESCPEVNCDTEIYHPNIDPTSDNYNVCLSLFDEWTSTYGIRDVTQGLLFLFYNPNVDDPLSTYFGDSLTDEEFEENVRASLRGEDVEDYSFPWNYHGNDPEMLKHKPKKGEKVQSEATTDVEGESENENGVTGTENAENSGERTENVNVEANEEKSDTTDNAESKEEEGTEKTEATVDVSIAKDEAEVQGITVILEKVSELMLQYPEDDEGKSEKEKSGEELHTVNDNVEEANNFVKNYSTEEDIRTTNDENMPNGANDNTDSNTENDNAIVTEVPSIDCALQRQTSKIERQCSVKEVTDDIPAKTEHPADDMSFNQTPGFSHYTDAFRTHTIAPQDIDLAVNMIGVACYYVYKSYVT